MEAHSIYSVITLLVLSSRHTAGPVVRSSSGATRLQCFVSLVNMARNEKHYLGRRRFVGRLVE